jgi:hypothetical protein
MQNKIQLEFQKSPVRLRKGGKKKKKKNLNERREEKKGYHCGKINNS